MAEVLTSCKESLYTAGPTFLCQVPAAYKDCLNPGYVHFYKYNFFNLMETDPAVFFSTEIETVTYLYSLPGFFVLPSICLPTVALKSNRSLPTQLGLENQQGALGTGGNFQSSLEASPSRTMVI
jgi:hypothetical protein